MLKVAIERIVTEFTNKVIQREEASQASKCPEKQPERILERGYENFDIDKNNQSQENDVSHCCVFTHLEEAIGVAVKRVQSKQKHDASLPGGVEEPPPEGGPIEKDIFHADSVESRIVQQCLLTEFPVKDAKPHNWQECKHNVEV